MDEVTQTTIGAIGEDDPAADWILRPQEHADKLPPQAGALARALRSDAIHQIMTRYTEFDARANAAQAVYKKHSRQAIYARLVAILIGGLFLLPIGGAGLAGAVAVKAALAVQYAGLAAALGLTAYISVRRLFSRWMAARAEAELARLALFDQVMKAREEARPGELPLLPLTLEYIRRYQLDVQTRYYGGRGEQHRRAAGQSSRVALLLQILSVLAFLPLFVVAADFFGLIQFDSLLPYLAFLAIGTAVSGVLGAIAAVSAMNLDERNAARYLVVHENLKDLTGKSLPAAREAAARGEAAAVGQFADAVQRLISSEHQEWILLRNHIQRPEQLVSVALDPVRVGMQGAGGGA